MWYIEETKENGKKRILPEWYANEPAITDNQRAVECDGYYRVDNNGFIQAGPYLSPPKIPAAWTTLKSGLLLAPTHSNSGLPRYKVLSGAPVMSEGVDFGMNEDEFSEAMK